MWRPLVLMIAGPEGGPSSYMQRYEDCAGWPAQSLMHRRRASWNIPDLLAWIFIKNGSRSRWRRAAAQGPWNIWARLPMSLARSASVVTVLVAPASRWRFAMKPGHAVMAFIANSQVWAIGATWWHRR